MPILFNIRGLLHLNMVLANQVHANSRYIKNQLCFHELHADLKFHNFVVLRFSDHHNGIQTPKISFSIHENCIHGTQ